MIFRSLLTLVLMSPVMSSAQSAEDNSATQQDRFGCDIVPRPDNLTFPGFQDAWRSVAADQLYGLRRYEAALTQETCVCAVLRSAWTTIADEFEG